eukprot:6441683-Prymnesium_polylepis.1
MRSSSGSVDVSSIVPAQSVRMPVAASAARRSLIFASLWMFCHEAHAHEATRVSGRALRAGGGGGAGCVSTHARGGNAPSLESCSAGTLCPSPRPSQWSRRPLLAKVERDAYALLALE